MSHQNEETVSTKFIIGLAMVLGSFFWIHARQQAAPTPRAITQDQVKKEVKLSTAETDDHQAPVTTAALPSAE